LKSLTCWNWKWLFQSNLNAVTDYSAYESSCFYSVHQDW